MFSFSGGSQVSTYWQRSYIAAGASWVMTIAIDTAHGHAGGGCLDAGMPQARAVVDDYGTLVAVGSWK